MTEVELQLKLDPEGRTISEQDNNTQVQIDYSSKTLLTSLADDSKHILFPDDADKRTDFLDDILFDCEISDCALLPRTFWVPAVGMEPRCALEQCALEVFRHHVKDGVVFDPKTSGCEWWVQIRPSPPAGRYNLLKGDDKKDDKNDEVDLETDGICFHWDKDEDLRLAMGGKMYIHPHISTVTYLSNSGAPTMALNYKVNPLTGDYITPSDNESVDAYLSWPKKGKHLSFDGRCLHAAPSNLMEKGAFKKQLIVSDEITDESARKKQTRRQRRVTFLVNIWLNYKPFNVEIFPDSMMDKLTKRRKDIPNILFKNDDNDEECVECEAKAQTYDFNFEGNKSFKWSMGGCDSNESISMEMPLQTVQLEMNGGGNVKISWRGEAGVTDRKGIRLIQAENSCETDGFDKKSNRLEENDEKRQKVK